MLAIGQIVYSKRGRDKLKPFIIVSVVDEEFVMIADGSLRKIEKPKKKKIKHIQQTKEIALEIQNKIVHGNSLLNAEIRRVLKPYY